MANDRTFVIVGAGQAGGWCAKTLRDQKFEGRIVMLGEEPDPPYERPPLSKQLLLGKMEPDKTKFWPDESWGQWNVEFRPNTRVARIDRAGRAVETASGERIAYDRLMIATGSRPRTLPVPGADLPGVHTLRTIPDSLAIRERIRAGARVVVVGGGWIGLEVAAGARKLGAEVTVVEALDRLCARALAPDVSGWLLGLHRGEGVEVRLKASVARFEGDGALARAVLADGSAIPCTLAVVGIGIVPNAELAAEAGLAIDNGIVVDDRGRTSDPDIFAAGDVTNHPNAVLGRRVRLESWENAQNQGIAAARAMLDAGEPYAEVPWFWSDQFEMNIQLVGLPDKYDATAVRGAMTDNEFTVFYLAGGKLVGAAGVNTGRDVRFCRRLIQAGVTASPAELADPTVKLQALAKR
jgi:3-phenylpropionate/trans-cinnamate dioxygenase ferredoxin reductase subunit